VSVHKPGYANAVRDFDWSAVLRDLDWHDRTHINLGHTIVDRHANADRVALYWIGKDRSTATMTYRDMRSLSNKVANLLRSLGVRKGDRVAGILLHIREIRPPSETGRRVVRQRRRDHRIFPDARRLPADGRGAPRVLQGPPYPAATGVLVAGLIRKDALIEIKATAVLGPGG
jgi:AMP-binding enzyme